LLRSEIRQQENRCRGLYIGNWNRLSTAAAEGSTAHRQNSTWFENNQLTPTRLKISA
jgi:hypothetical protein